MMLQAGVITIFPEMFDALLDSGVTGRAFDQGLVGLETLNPRTFCNDAHRTVDDRPYGGGPGMVMKAEPLISAVDDLKTRLPAGSPVIYLSPQGRPLQQKDVQRMATWPGMILLAGRYEGIDERVVETCVDEEWSIGDYVLSGGELAAMVLLDAVIRLLPGALGHNESAEQDSFSTPLLDCPHYTRPEQLKGLGVPPVLLGGNHEAIRQWRLQQALVRTHQRRPDLLQGQDLTEEQQRLLDEYLIQQTI